MLQNLFTVVQHIGGDEDVVQKLPVQPGHLQLVNPDAAYEIIGFEPGKLQVPDPAGNDLTAEIFQVCFRNSLLQQVLLDLNPGGVVILAA